jgi:hypothetical protein
MAELGACEDAAARMIANELRKMTDVDDYQFAVQPTYEDGATPENPGMAFKARCVADHIDHVVIAYVTMRLG